MLFSRCMTPGRSKLATGCVLLLCAALLMAIGTAAPAKKKSSSHGSSSNRGNHGQPVDKFDKKMAKQETQLLKKLVDQHQAAINLALAGDLGTTLTAGGDVASTVTTAAINSYCKAYALRMQTEMDQYKAWLKLWYKITYNPKHQGPDDEDEDTLVGLTGDEFTAALLDQLIGVHMRGIAFEKQADKKGFHPEFKAYAKNAKALDYQEVAQIKAWIKLFEADDEDQDQDQDRD